MDVRIKPNQSRELEEVLPNDRVVQVENGVTYLADNSFEITEEMIEETL